MRSLLCLPLLLLSLTAFSEVIILEGVYQGKDLYVKNPFTDDGVGFCVFEVLVNGQVTTDEVNSSAFAVDLTLFELEIGDPLEVVIRTKDNCSAKVINPEAIRPRSTFAVSSMEVSTDGMLTWTTTGESGPLPFVIEQLKWNKWVAIGEVMGQGKPSTNSYTFAVAMHDGTNTFRVSQKGVAGNHSSDRIEANSNAPKITLKSEKVFDKVEFSSSTPFELFNEYGVLVAQGSGKEIDVRKMPKGRYYLNFGSQFGQLITKK
jgi:hypothetical protein